MSLEIEGKEEDDYFHVLMDLTDEEIKFALLRDGYITQYVVYGSLSDIIEFRQYFQQFPLPYKLPEPSYIHKSLPEVLDGGLLEEDSLIDNDPHRLEVFLPIVLEYYKFTGKILLRKTFKTQRYAHIFTKWKGEYKNRYKVLYKILAEYREMAKDDDEGIPAKIKKEILMEVREQIRDELEDELGEGNNVDKDF